MSGLGATKGDLLRDELIFLVSRGVAFVARDATQHPLNAIGQCRNAGVEDFESSHDGQRITDDGLALVTDQWPVLPPMKVMRRGFMACPGVS